MIYCNTFTCCKVYAIMREEGDYYRGTEGDTKEIIKRYEDMLRSSSTYYFDVFEFENIIDYYLDLQNAPGAGVAAEIARQQHPYSSELQLKHAEILIADKKFEEANALLDLLSQIEPKNPDVLLLLGKLYLAKKWIVKANSYFKKVLVENLENRTEIISNICAMLLDIGDTKSALPYLEMAIAEEPANENLWFDLAYCYDREGKTPEAVKGYIRYLDYDPFNDSAWYNLGLLYSREEEHEKALDAFEYCVAIIDEIPIYVLSLAHTLATLERYPKAIELFKELLETDPENVNALCSIGECYEKLGDYGQATSYYDKTLLLDPENAEAYYGLAVIHMDKGNYFGSLAMVNLCLKYDDVNPEYWFGLGKVYHKLGSIPESISAYEKAILLDEEDVDSISGLAYIYIEQHDEDRALRNFLKCIEISEEVEFLVQAAILEFHKGMRPQAFEHLQKAINLDEEAGVDFFNEYPELKNLEDLL